MKLSRLEILDKQFRNPNNLWWRKRGVGTIMLCEKFCPGTHVVDYVRKDKFIPTAADYQLDSLLTHDCMTEQFWAIEQGLSNEKVWFNSMKTKKERMEQKKFLKRKAKYLTQCLDPNALWWRKAGLSWMLFGYRRYDWVPSIKESWISGFVTRDCIQEQLWAVGCGLSNERV